ncbi:MAG: type II toxin-antitoxin system VapC family toxin [Promethearchaeota archaeon]
MGLKLSLDTNVFISIHNSKPDSSSCAAILKSIKANGWECWISVITISEMLVGYYNQRSFSEAEQFVLLMQKNYNIQPINLQVAQLGAQYRSKYQMKLPDALILASGMVNKVEVFVSNNIQMHQDFPIPIVSAGTFLEDYDERTDI